MKTIKLTIIILLAAAVLSFIKSDKEFSIIKILPFADGTPVNEYHWAALIVLLITWWGCSRLKKKDDENALTAILNPLHFVFFLYADF